VRLPALAAAATATRNVRWPSLSRTRNRLVRHAVTSRSHLRVDRNRWIFECRRLLPLLLRRIGCRASRDAPPAHGNLLRSPACAPPADSLLSAPSKKIAVIRPSSASGRPTASLSASITRSRAPAIHAYRNVSSRNVLHRRGILGDHTSLSANRPLHRHRRLASAQPLLARASPLHPQRQLVSCRNFASLMSDGRACHGVQT